MPAVNSLPRLELPKRWELLRARADEAGVDPVEFVERVDSAADRIDKLLNRVRTAGGGLFEIVLGLSGSGKTTFLNTLPKFFEHVRVEIFPRDAALTGLSEFIKQRHIAGDRVDRIVVIERRDNPQPADLQHVEAMLVELLETFREPYGGVLVLWPITDPEAARIIAERAWQLGRDSIADSETKGLYRFQGIPRERYFTLADATSKSLTGDGLEAFGIDDATGKGLLANCETISDFFGEIVSRTDGVRDKTWSVLKERFRARMWVLLPGDDGPALRNTIAALTQGTRNRVDIDRIGEFIDRPGEAPLYVNEWKKRRAGLAHLLRAIDVRIFELPPNVALAAIRAFGDDAAKKPLKQRSANLRQSKDAMKSTRIYKAILAEAGVAAPPYAGFREVKPETAQEYLRVQPLAASNDKPLNKALGLLIDACLKEDAPSLSVVSEKRDIEGSKLQPDVRIVLGPGDLICLEPTWRSSGAGIAGERAETQSTMTEAHLQVYMLGKAMQYVRDLDL